MRGQPHVRIDKDDVFAESLHGSGIPLCGPIRGTEYHLRTMGIRDRCSLIGTTAVAYNDVIWGMALTLEARQTLPDHGG
jgi:hypothetical protein